MTSVVLNVVIDLMSDIPIYMNGHSNLQQQMHVTVVLSENNEVINIMHFSANIQYIFEHFLINYVTHTLHIDRLPNKTPIAILNDCIWYR